MATAEAPGHLVFVCAMPMELVPLTRRLSLTPDRIGDLDAHLGSFAGRRVIAIVTGMGTVLARDGTRRLLDAVAVERVLVVGITGALDDDTPIGTVVLPEVVVHGHTGTEHRPHHLGGGRPRGRMWTSDDLTTDAAVLADLRSRGVVALDMETAAIAQLCEERSIPWSVFRAISDRATDGTVDEEVFHMSNQDGTPNHAAIAAYFERHPERVELMARMADDAALATERAAEAAVLACAHLSPDGAT